MDQPSTDELPLRRIISGGQTGVDRAALDVAIQLGIPHGGRCPRGRLAEDGRIPGRYRLAEMPTRAYAARTEQNVRDADATLILSPPPLSGGTLLTSRIADRLGKPRLILDPYAPDAAGHLRRWLEAEPIAVLNVAGPRESQQPGIATAAANVLREALEATPPSA